MSFACPCPLTTPWPLCSCVGESKPSASCYWGTAWCGLLWRRYKEPHPCSERSIFNWWTCCRGGEKKQVLNLYKSLANSQSGSVCCSSLSACHTAKAATDTSRSCHWVRIISDSWLMWGSLQITLCFLHSVRKLHHYINESKWRWKQSTVTLV